MKHKLLHLFAIILATFISTNVAQAQTTKPSSYKFSKATQVWKTDFAGTDPAVRHQPGFYRQAAASDGRIFTVPGGTDAETYPAYSSAHVSFGHVIGNGTQFHWSGGSKNDKMPYTSDGNYYYLGPAIAADEEGTLWCTSLRTSSAPGSMPWAIGAKAFTYYTTRPVEGNTEAINEIIIYNEAGVEVMNEVGDGENITTVNIENLATGFYFVKVNNQAPVKIAKK